MTSSSVDLILKAAELIGQNSKGTNDNGGDYMKENGMSGRDEVGTERKKANQTTGEGVILTNTNGTVPTADFSNHKHNENERKRRKLLKHSQYSLRDQLRKKTRRPALNSVLKAAYEEIQELKELETEQGKVLEELKQKNIILNYFLEKLLKDIKDQKETTKGKASNRPLLGKLSEISQKDTPSKLKPPTSQTALAQQQQWASYSPTMISPIIPSPLLYSPHPTTPIFTYQPQPVGGGAPLISYTNGFHQRPAYSIPYICSPSHSSPFYYEPFLMQTTPPPALAVPTYKSLQDRPQARKEIAVQKASYAVTELEECEVKISREVNKLHSLSSESSDDNDREVHMLNGWNNGVESPLYRKDKHLFIAEHSKKLHNRVL